MTDEPDAAAEQQAILEEWARRQAAWKTWNGHSAGCVTLVVALLVLTGLPRFNPNTFSPALRSTMMWAGVALAIVGFVVMQVRRVPYDVKELIDESVAILQRADADMESRRRAAVVLLFHHLDARGPTMTANFDAGEVRGRLSREGYTYVAAAEAILRDEIKLGPVFLPPPPPQEPV